LPGTNAVKNRIHIFFRSYSREISFYVALRGSFSTVVRIATALGVDAVKAHGDYCV
jgi:hypothetical protein